MWKEALKSNEEIFLSLDSLGILNTLGYAFKF